MNTMSYLGYTATIAFDERDDLFVGRILGIRAIISFEAQSVKALHSAFHHAVDDYLAECSEKGAAPEKMASGKLLLRLSPEIHQRATVVAKASGQSLNQWVSNVLERAVNLDA